MCSGRDRKAATLWMSDLGRCCNLCDHVIHYAGSKDVRHVALDMFRREAAEGK